MKDLLRHLQLRTFCQYTRTRKNYKAFPIRKLSNRKTNGENLQSIIKYTIILSDECNPTYKITHGENLNRKIIMRSFTTPEIIKHILGNSDKIWHSIMYSILLYSGCVPS